MQELGAEITELIDRAIPALDALIQRVSYPAVHFVWSANHLPSSWLTVLAIEALIYWKATKLSVIAICCDLVVCDAHVFSEDNKHLQHGKMMYGIVPLS
jgi:hypothetical protein